MKLLDGKFFAVIFWESWRGQTAKLTANVAFSCIPDLSNEHRFKKHNPLLSHKRQDFCKRSIERQKS